MGQKLNRVVRGCIELGATNPICSIHDQGAGGNGNVLKEIVNPQGAKIYLNKFIKGDQTLSALEIWCAEYQESNALLTQEPDVIQAICKREKLPMAIVGQVTSNGYITLVDDMQQPDSNLDQQVNHPVHLKLSHIFDSVPQKVFELKTINGKLTPLVDRSVTGLVAQQQCVGPLHTPLADVGVVALSHFNTVGSAIALGEQPFKMFINPAAGARLTVGEALTNIVFAQLSSLKDIKCSANWMWPAKMPGEGARLYQACHAMCQVMKLIGIAIDGGKDSLSMAADVDGCVVKSPGTLVISAYCSCPDITATVTPDLKEYDDNTNKIIYLHVSEGKFRLGGSAVAQVFQQIGDVVPDLENVDHFKRTLNQLQVLFKNNLCSSGHDVSDGGLATTLLEMAFAGNCGIKVDIGSLLNYSKQSIIEILFAEELGIVVEVTGSKVAKVIDNLKSNNIQYFVIGSSIKEKMIQIFNDGTSILSMDMTKLRDMWEETSFELDRLQANPQCVQSERLHLLHSLNANYSLSFKPIPLDDSIAWPLTTNSLRVAVVREEGSNGDREMAAALHLVGFEVWDIITSDLQESSMSLDCFCGIVFVGGFSYADVLGSARGWSAAIGWNDNVRRKLIKFRNRFDTFTLGVCNGCQLMAHLGWIGNIHTMDEIMADDYFNMGSASCITFTENISNRFESRFPTVKILDSPAIMLQGMANSQLGIWVAHAEGYAKFSSDQILKNMLELNLAPIRYVDSTGRPTEEYPFNPNGSPCGIAGLCSRDGRHLAMMPHPERCIHLWQWPWVPHDWKQSIDVSPWLKMFRNAYEWSYGIKFC
ncbi:uncharacterized protein TRIADDRAFT_56338 [Trichoplax adhaerens]|uniref:phosphoribosylformylglycinamidine synthase n=1 Tax=Trichoplax adhaerens TaxID=10228 RepID=B3RXU9_TRIAD|nr:hypothetical protein TRIADDRAFT_56338 [Trichoplax adhaerens]EDV24919.1 hypothetical protein TRIADDRAFT_56338 [Trichoplax adhaerens]|eukprot:XP_002112809.1 hypothetical protein TRIADDRAFT_56338 [Trichoplax adhaerens]